MAAIAMLTLSGCDGSDESPPDAAESTTALIDEVALHDGQNCPKELPQADAPTHGLGTAEPAKSAPKLAAPDEAWVCVYGAMDAGSGPDGDGMTYAWKRTQDPVGVRPSHLADLEQHLDALMPGPADAICTADLGPRFVLVYRHGTDLTGVSVDDFGCRDVLLTDDPFTTVPGEATQRGTVPGVLQAPPDLLDELKAVAGG